MRIKVVIDTSVLLSAAFRDRVPEVVVRFVAKNPDFEWIATSDIVTEYIEVIAREKFGLSSSQLDDWRNLIQGATTLVATDRRINFQRDPKDGIFLACALSVQANFLITGDRDFDDARKILDTTVLSVRQFKELVIDHWN
jgi:putative PIN family toxin of toxin-antitoxin system